MTPRPEPTQGHQPRTRRLRAIVTLIVGGAIGVALVLGMGYVVLALAVGAALGPGQDPPRPAESLVPELISDVVEWEHGSGCGVRRLRLRDGEVLEIRTGGSGQFRCGEGPWHTNAPLLSSTWLELGSFTPDFVAGRSGLLMYGHFPSGGEWVAAARRSGGHPEVDDCRFEMREEGYLSGSFVHLSSGLVSEKADEFQDLGVAGERPDVVRGDDTTCLNAQGEAVAIIRGWGGLY